MAVCLYVCISDGSTFSLFLSVDTRACRLAIRFDSFLADRPNGRSYATMLRPSVYRFNLRMYCDKTVRLIEKLSEETLKQIGNGLWLIEWSRDR